ncbi:MAG: DUF2703 domain-containing protein [Deltaproteobacteria bacterium]|nr:DUF2703 domain-containing protein [Deltaproteobacteria bacterium]
MKTIQITWQRLVDDQGRTCDRCRGTEQELHKALRFLVRSLAPMGIAFSLETRALDVQEFTRDPSQSNRVWIDGRPLEKWLGAQVGASPCGGPCGDADCRTLMLEGVIYETIPAELIIRAALQAVEREVKRLTATPLSR